MSDSVAEYFKCPPEYVSVICQPELSAKKGYFKYGDDLVCFGRCSGHLPEPLASTKLFDVFQNACVVNGQVLLPFDVDEVLRDLRLEIYADHSKGDGIVDHPAIVSAYYWLRPLLPVYIRKYLQKVKLRNWNALRFPGWPVDCTVDRLCEAVLLENMKKQGLQSIPFIWFWPEQYSGAAMMTHDVETALGRDYSEKLMDMDDSFAIKASFQVVPEGRYDVPGSYIDVIWDRGFEIAVHDLNHDGRLYRDFETFSSRVKKINEYRREFRARGFRAAVLYRRQLWYDALEFAYDMSVPNVAHLDPQRGGCCTVKPYFIGNIIELPVTTTQDYSLFHVLKTYSVDLWKKQIEVIIGQHGLASFIVHPDYVITHHEQAIYRELLAHLQELKSKQNVWIALPCEIEKWWRERAQMRIIEEDGELTIEGSGADQASIAYASEEDGRLVYSFAPNNPINAPKPRASAKVPEEGALSRGQANW